MRFKAGGGAILQDVLALGSPPTHPHNTHRIGRAPEQRASSPKPRKPSPQEQAPKNKRGRGLAHQSSVPSPPRHTTTSTISASRSLATSAHWGGDVDARWRRRRWAPPPVGGPPPAFEAPPPGPDPPPAYEPPPPGSDHRPVSDLPSGQGVTWDASAGAVWWWVPSWAGSCSCSWACLWVGWRWRLRSSESASCKSRERRGLGEPAATAVPSGWSGSRGSSPSGSLPPESPLSLPPESSPSALSPPETLPERGGEGG